MSQVLRISTMTSLAALGFTQTRAFEPSLPGSPRPGSSSCSASALLPGAWGAGVAGTLDTPQAVST